MRSGLKFAAFFLVFLLIGVLIAGLVMGHLTVEKTFETKKSKTEVLNYLSDYHNLKNWITHLDRVDTTDIPEEYSVYLKTGKKESAKMELSYATTTDSSAGYELSNRGSELITSFVFVNDSMLHVVYEVKGKGVANKMVLAMLKKRLQDQYEEEIGRISKLLN